MAILKLPDSDVLTRLATQRQSVRAFLPEPVPQSLLHQILMSARQAPSGANLQPGSFLLVEGQARRRLSAALSDAWRNGLKEVGDYGSYPDPMPMGLRRRPRRCMARWALGARTAQAGMRSLNEISNFLTRPWPW